ncbi:ATP-dependent metallopeptidase FtsH/Yme1/Tma family protein [Thermoleophilia bacterium SCSIO 60948]|nr:ATP-dependent metallopeptidase FtsH/Yme1/Tma family protein [Thermoleophilia bacterium SCSIO 60948]
MRRFFRSAAFPILIVVILAFFAQRLIAPPTGDDEPTWNEFSAQIDDSPSDFKEVTVDQGTEEVTVVMDDDSETEYTFGYPSELEASLIEALDRNDVDTRVEGIGGGGILSVLTYILPFLLFLGFWLFLMNQMQGGGSKVMSFGKSRAKRMSVDAPKITFRDVAGADEAVQELHEIKEFLENPKKFQALGARIPKGVLLYGPPGTGKTLLARAVAGEAGVPFFSISGSDFVEMFVGVGASRVRDLFEQAKQNSPCIIFMDEIDAVGRHRGAGMGGGHDEREQTLNQLLVEMDGFEMKDNIILIAATNRPDILDPALLRPGRFDRQIVVDRPDRKGRKKILEVHTRGKPLGKEIDLDALAGQTPGFTGADLANLINESALLTARSGKREITMQELEEGIMRVIAGPEKKTRVMSEKERLITAYHELGHAIVGHVLPNCDPVHKVSIVGRGQALGYTISLPQEDKFLTSRAELAETMAMTLGGRAAEEIVFSEITTGASNDLEKVTATAKGMVMRYGMSERLGPRVFGNDRSQPFLGRELGNDADYSDEIAREIDDEIRRIVEDAHQSAKDILIERREGLDRISNILLARETIDAREFEQLLDGASEEEVFGPDDAEGDAPAEAEEESETADSSDGREAARPPMGRPRPGFAGGTEMRADEPRS